MRTPLITALTIVVYVDAFLWIVAVLPTLYYALQRRGLPTLFGIRLLSGPFEALGIDALIVAGLAYVIVSGLKILAAYWIGNGRLDGALLEAILLGLSAIFWYGFMLPLGPLLGIAQVVLLALTWSSFYIDMRNLAWFERAAWIGLLAVSLIIVLFGLGDMLGGAQDLQNGEAVLMHSLAGQSWNELQAASPGAANLIDWKFRTDGAALAVLAGLCVAIGLTAFRRGERWAWLALWALPAWMVLTAGFTAGAVRYPGYGTPVPVISGIILTVVCVLCLAVSYRRFFR